MRSTRNSGEPSGRRKTAGVALRFLLIGFASLSLDSCGKPKNVEVESIDQIKIGDSLNEAVKRIEDNCKKCVLRHSEEDALIGGGFLGLYGEKVSVVHLVGRGGLIEGVEIAYVFQDEESSKAIFSKLISTAGVGEEKSYDSNKSGVVAKCVDYTANTSTRNRICMGEKNGRYLVSKGSLAEIK